MNVFDWDDVKKGKLSPLQHRRISNEWDAGLRGTYVQGHDGILTAGPAVPAASGTLEVGFMAGVEGIWPTFPTISCLLHEQNLSTPTSVAVGPTLPSLSFDHYHCPPLLPSTSATPNHSAFGCMKLKMHPTYCSIIHHGLVLQKAT